MKFWHICLLLIIKSPTFNSCSFLFLLQHFNTTIENSPLQKRGEECPKVKKLGTLLGDSEENKRRKQLTQTTWATFQKLKNIWSNKTNKISTAPRIRLYETYITPILTYNAGTWALTKKEIRRRHFRIILGICYPNIISNKELYRGCKAQELHTMYHFKLVKTR